MGAATIHIQGTDLEFLIEQAQLLRQELQIGVLSDVEIVKRALKSYIGELDGTRLAVEAMKQDL